MRDTITAIATPPGRGGVGVIRISGPDTETIATKIIGSLPKPRYAQYAKFKSQAGELIDLGLSLYFPGPNSFTGESVLELHTHGSPIVLDQLLAEIIKCGARLARPGEFSERAFLNDKIDLAQAESIADLIDSSSKQAARAAIRSLQGEFSNKIHELVKELIYLRTYIEAAIDFPDEDVDFLADEKLKQKMVHLKLSIQNILAQSEQGCILQEGITIVLAGRPNAGKSTLLNALCGKEAAIVTDIPGTTRDVMKEYISIDGLPAHIIDTAGLRDSDDVIEQEGVRRAIDTMQKADLILLLIDIENENSADLLNDLQLKLPQELPIAIVINKIDKENKEPCVDSDKIYLSALHNNGIDLLKKVLKEKIGFHPGAEGALYSARRRHIDALTRAQTSIDNANTQLSIAGELAAEECRQAQLALNEITGEFTSDDLLGEIFSNFCIGK